ncbi:MAG: endo-1,4-beta-xylanase [Thermoleophilaceae bacterium]|nr:endo-1,4-beta-xylanase [Thermoleophilaceae bacterium]
MPARRLALAVGLALLVGACAAEDEGDPIPPPKDAAAPPRLARTLGAAVSAKPAREDPTYLRAFVSNFTSMTPENEMKWAIVHPDRDRYAFGDADALVGLARGTGKRVRGHTLVWDAQLPAWVTDSDWEAPELRRVLVGHVKGVASHFRGRVAQWDVVNEPFLPSGRLKTNVFSRVLGPGYIALAFRAARAADPHAKLFLNENYSEHPGPKQNALVRLVAALRRRGVPIDGVGLQAHTEAGKAAGAARLSKTMRRFTRLGLDVEITELDVALTPGGSLGVQARDYGGTARACAAEPRCTGLTVWGVTDKWSWIGAEKRALPLDERGRAKPALTALKGAL